MTTTIVNRGKVSINNTELPLSGLFGTLIFFEGQHWFFPEVVIALVIHCDSLPKVYGGERVQGLS